MKGDSVLLVRRGAEPAYGKWSIPGGVVDVGETLLEAVARELKEECDLEVEMGPLVEVVDRVVLDAEGRTEYHFVIADFVARWIAGEPLAATDILEARWVQMDRLDEMDTTEGLAQVLRGAATICQGLASFPAPTKVAGSGLKGGNYGCATRVNGT